MILQTKFKLEEDGWVLVRTVSSRGMKVRQIGTGEIYDEAIDPDFMNREYEETDIPVEEDAHTPEEDIPDFVQEEQPEEE